MPWCEDCSKYWNPTSMKSDGSCPTCGKVIGEPAGGAPWHFKLLMVALVAYLGFRAFQGVEWVLGRL